jgi:hypothetical protein
MNNRIPARVFVSSVMSGFAEYRAAARAGVTDAGGAPVLIEDYPALDSSSRTACLDLVRSSDVYLLIVGDRAGSAPLGKPVVEQEFEEARRRKLPRLLFMQDVARDATTTDLLKRLSDFVHGRFRTTFQTPDELRSAVADALRVIVGGIVNTERNTPDLLDNILPANERGVAPVLRLAVIPERKDEVFDVLQFDDQQFRRTLFEIGHRHDVQLFSYEQGPKTATVKDNTLTVVQEASRGVYPAIGVTVEIRENGAVMIEQTLTDRRASRYGMGNLQIPEQDVASAIQSSLAFINALYDTVDPGQRFATFFYAAGLAGMSVHVVVTEIKERNSFSLPMNDRGWLALDKPRKIDRTDLAKPDDIVDRLLTFVRKRYGDRS